MSAALFGVPVVVEPVRYRYQLPDDLPLPPGFREEFNAWARSFLGTLPPLLEDGEVLSTCGRLHMNAATWAQVQKQLRKAA